MIPPALIERRYLQGFRVSRVPHRFSDLLVLGSGVAGLSAALEAAADSDVEVLLASKDELDESNTRWAQGGIAAVLHPERTEDSADRHVADTISAASGLADEEVVRVTVREGIERVRELIDLGVEFDRDEAGEIQFTREGGHSAPRILHRGDTTGQEIERGLLEAVAARPNIHCLPHAFVLDLLLDDDGSAVGALIHTGGALQAVWAKAVILATGGAGQIYRETTNPGVATGDGLAMAFRAGAELQDLEFIQFHPTTLYLAGTDRFLITEAVRGEGGVLRDDDGEAFMSRFHPLADLAPRDVVSRGILTVMKETGANKVWLDLSGIPRDRVRARFPRILEFLAQFGLDILSSPIPVRPSAHYTIGGVRTDLVGATSIPGLFAAGEVASTGLHGANRLGSNSLLEGLVFGRRAGAAARAHAAGRPLPRPFSTARDGDQRRPPAGIGVVHPEDLVRSLKSVMWYQVGVERAGRELTAAVEQIGTWLPYCLRSHFQRPDGWSLQNMVQTAYLVALSALRRTESRGVHFRSDFPDRDDEIWRVHSSISRAELAHETGAASAVDSLANRSAGSETR